MNGSRPISAEVYVGDKGIGTATDVEVDFGVARRESSVATGTVEPQGAWKVYAPKPLPPWTPEYRDRVRQELRSHPLVEVTFGPYPSPNGVVGTVTRVVDPQPTVLREERRARAANVRHYCRKCRGLGTKRHHAMCSMRGVWRQTYKWVAPGHESGQDRRKQAHAATTDNLLSRMCDQILPSHPSAFKVTFVETNSTPPTGEP